jgi:hypothetical protein
MYGRFPKFSAPKLNEIRVAFRAVYDLRDNLLVDVHQGPVERSEERLDGLLLLQCVDWHAGPYEDDPNVTDKKFPGNQTRSYRSREPLRIVAVVTD